MNRHSRSRALVAACILAASIGCGSDGKSITGSFSGSGVRILTPTTVEDTIGAPLAASLTVEVHDGSGELATAARITVSTRRDVAAMGAGLASFSLSRGAPGVPALVDVSDTRGQLSMGAVLSEIIGSGWIIADAGALGRDSIRVVIRAGAPAILTLSPRDTAVAVGASYALTSQVRDRWSNLLTGVPTLVTRRAQVASIVDGHTIRSASSGRAYVVGTVGTAIDSVAISVVPSGTLAAFRFISSSGDITTLATFDLDGSNYQETLIPDFGYNNYSPHWIPQQSSLVFHGRNADVAYELGLFTMGATNQRRLITPTPDAGAAYPQPSRDGAWIYYTQSVGSQSTEVWRMRLDGTGRSRIGPKAGYYDSDTQPSPSPDGKTLVYVSADGRLNSLDIATGVKSSLGVSGKLPRWAPVANEIAYVTQDAVRIVQSDGTGDRVLAAGVRFDDRDGQVDWSPDGKWLVACAWSQYSGTRRLVLIERATGELLLLPFTSRQNLCEATWKR